MYFMYNHKHNALFVLFLCVYNLFFALYKIYYLYTFIDVCYNCYSFTLQVHLDYFKLWKTMVLTAAYIYRDRQHTYLTHNIATQQFIHWFVVHKYSYLTVSVWSRLLNVSSKKKFFKSLRLNATQNFFSWVAKEHNF